MSKFSKTSLKLEIVYKEQLQNICFSHNFLLSLVYTNAPQRTVFGPYIEQAMVMMMKEVFDSYRVKLFIGVSLYIF